MKKILYFAAIAALTAVSCAKENVQEIKTITLTAVAAGEETKTVLTDGTKTYWAQGDAISVFDAQKINRPFTTAITSSQATAEFTYEGTFEQPDTYWAFYPQNTNIATSDFSTFTGLNIPEVQTAIKNGFDPTATLAYGSSTGSEIKFHNLTALVKFTVTEGEIYSVKLSATGDKLAGEATFDGSKLSATKSEVTLKGGMFIGNTYYIAVTPGTFSALKIFVNGVEAKSYSNKTLVAGTIYNMGELDNPLESVAGYCTSFNNDLATTFTTEEIQAVIPEFDPTVTDNIKDPISIRTDTYSYHYNGSNIFAMAEDGYTMTSYMDGEEYIVNTTDHETQWRNDTTNGQLYGILYDWFNQPLYFNIDWESKYNGQEGVYPIVDIQDRHGNHNTVVLNHSYYDSTTKTFVLDFIAAEGSITKFFVVSLTK